MKNCEHRDKIDLDKNNSALK